MTALVITLLIVLAIGPLALRYGADSRVVDERDRRTWWPGVQRSAR